MPAGVYDPHFVRATNKSQDYGPPLDWYAHLGFQDSCVTLSQDCTKLCGTAHQYCMYLTQACTS